MSLTHRFYDAFICLSLGSELGRYREVISFSQTSINAVKRKGLLFPRQLTTSIMHTFF
jgi:hypothetical protein